MGDSYVTLHAQSAIAAAARWRFGKSVGESHCRNPRRRGSSRPGDSLSSKPKRCATATMSSRKAWYPARGSGSARRGRRAVRGKEAGRGCLSDLLGCPLEIEVPRSVWGRQDTNAAQHCVRDTAVLCRIAGEDIGRIDLFERAAAVNVGFGYGTPPTRPRIGCSCGARATPPTAAGTSGSPRDCRRSSNRRRCPGRREG
jgi:hypothetical protein